MNPLAQLLRELTPELRQWLAAECGTTVGMLYQVAGGHSINPRARMVLALEDASSRLAADGKCQTVVRPRELVNTLKGKK